MLLVATLFVGVLAALGITVAKTQGSLAQTTLSTKLSRNDGAKAKLYDVRADPKMRNNRAADRPEVAKRMFEDYVLEDTYPGTERLLPSADLVLYSPRLAAIALSRRLTLRAAMFGWIMPLVAALLYSRWDSSRILLASSSSPECTAL
jgi:hypothetical protein